MESLVSFELTPAEVEQLRRENWRNGSADLQAQSIVRDHLLRARLKAERNARREKNLRDRGFIKSQHGQT